MRWPLAGPRRAEDYQDGVRFRRRAGARRVRDFSEVFGPELAGAHAQTEEDLARARKIAHAFRFICPSYYVPGKQDWGAF